MIITLNFQSCTFHVALARLNPSLFNYHKVSSHLGSKKISSDKAAFPASLNVCISAEIRRGNSGSAGSACQRGRQKVFDIADSFGGFKLFVKIFVKVLKTMIISARKYDMS